MKQKLFTVKVLRTLIREELESPPTVVSPGSQGPNSPAPKWDERVLAKVRGRLVTMMTLADETVDMVTHAPDIQQKMVAVRKMVRAALTDVNDSV